jgi:ABC-type transport system substrate-binding protein
VDSTVFRETVFARGQFDMYIGRPASYGSASAQLFAQDRSGGPQNQYGLKDNQLDDLIDRQATLSRDPEGRKRLLLDIQRRILDLGYRLPLGTIPSPNVFKGRVQNFWPPSVGGVQNAWTGAWLK